MDEVEAGQTGSQTGPQPGAVPRTIGETLRDAREAQGLSLADVTARTRVPLRHLEAIEAGDYSTLPSPTYAVGFARAYARAVGADEVAVAQGVRIEVDRLGRRQPEYAPYEVTDPARVPSRGVAIVAAGLALGLLVLVALYFGGGWLRGDTPSVPAADTAPVVTSRVLPAPVPSAATGEVVLSASDEVWMRVYDVANTTLFTGTMKPGERFVVPAGAADPKIDVGRPDKLTVTLNGAAVPPLGTGERAINAVRIGAAALAARLAGTPAPLAVLSAPPPAAPAPSASASTASSLAPLIPAPIASASASPEPRAVRMSVASRPRRTAQRERARPRPRRVLTETQRANLEAARNLPRPRARPRQQ